MESLVKLMNKRYGGFFSVTPKGVTLEG